MVGSKRPSNAELDLFEEFVHTEVQRQVLQNETALLQLLESIATCREPVLSKLEEVYSKIYGGEHLASIDLLALSRILRAFEVLSGRAAVRKDLDD